MSDNHQLEYLNLVELVDHYNLDVSAAELHGLITGSVCTARLNSVEDNWVKLLTPYDPLDDHQLEHLNDSLKVVYSLTSNALEGDGFAFTPVLPDEDASSDFRTGELAAWCRGFVLVYQHHPQTDNLSEDSQEAYEDLTEIAYAELGDGEDEEHAQALAELEEYIRISVQMIFDDLNPVTKIH